MQRSLQHGGGSAVRNMMRSPVSIHSEYHFQYVYVGVRSHSRCSREYLPRAIHAAPHTQYQADMLKGSKLLPRRSGCSSYTITRSINISSVARGAMVDDHVKQWLAMPPPPMLTCAPVTADPLLKSTFVLPITLLEPAAALLGSRKFRLESDSFFLRRMKHRVRTSLSHK